MCILMQNYIGICFIPAFYNFLISLFLLVKVVSEPLCFFSSLSVCVSGGWALLLTLISFFCVMGHTSPILT